MGRKMIINKFWNWIGNVFKWNPFLYIDLLLYLLINDRRNNQRKLISWFLVYFGFEFRE